jgi:uncharacterized protein involved in exopolysaccharide biosynthesis
MIFGFCLAAFVLASGVALLMPDIYSATARALPLDEKAGGIYVGMLKGQDVADAIIDKFDLLETYQLKSRSLAYSALNSHVSISEGKKDQIISITVEDNDPNRAAEMANAYVEELKKLSEKNHLSGAATLRQYLEGRLVVVRQDLGQAEGKLKAFQIKNKTIRIDDQSAATIEAIARLKGELDSKEIELGGSPELEQLKTQVNALEQSSIGGKVSGDIALASTGGPGLGLQYAELLQDFRMQVTLLELLTRQYEVARIEEVKTPLGIQVLGSAIVPAKKIKPQRSLIVLLSTFAAGFLGVLAAFIREYGERMCEEDRQRWQAIKSSLGLRRSAGV